MVSYAPITARECPDQWLSPWSVDPVITHTLMVLVWSSVLFQWILSLWVMICHVTLSPHATWLLMSHQCNQSTTWYQLSRATCFNIKQHFASWGKEIGPSIRSVISVSVPWESSTVACLSFDGCLALMSFSNISNNCALLNPGSKSSFCFFLTGSQLFYR